MAPNPARPRRGTVTRAQDKRTLTGRSPGERRHLRQLRLQFAREHPKMSTEDMATSFYARGWYSPTSYRRDAINWIKRMRATLNKTTW